MKLKRLFLTCTISMLTGSICMAMNESPEQKENLYDIFDTYLDNDTIQEISKSKLLDTLLIHEDLLGLAEGITTEDYNDPNTPLEFKKKCDHIIRQLQKLSLITDSDETNFEENEDSGDIQEKMDLELQCPEYKQAANELFLRYEFLKYLKDGDLKEVYGYLSDDVMLDFIIDEGLHYSTLWSIVPDYDDSSEQLLYRKKIAHILVHNNRVQNDDESSALITLLLSNPAIQAWHSSKINDDFALFCTRLSTKGGDESDNSHYSNTSNDSELIQKIYARYYELGAKADYPQQLLENMIWAIEVPSMKPLGCFFAIQDTTISDDIKFENIRQTLQKLVAYDCSIRLFKGKEEVLRSCNELT